MRKIGGVAVRWVQGVRVGWVEEGILVCGMVAGGVAVVNLLVSRVV